MMSDENPAVGDVPPTEEDVRKLTELRIKELEKDAAGPEQKVNVKLTSDGCIKQTVVPEKSARSDEFLPCDKFDGDKTGFVFKMGERGLGYYADNTGKMLKAISKMEAKLTPNVTRDKLAADAIAAAAREAGTVSSTAIVPAGDPKEGKAIEVKFTQEKWGMTARMSGGPVLVTKMRPDSEALSLGVEIGDEIVRVDGIPVATNRSVALTRLRKGGATSVVLFRSAVKPSASLTAGVAADEQAEKTVALNAGDAPAEGWSVKEVQAMIGSAKAKDTVTVAGKKGESQTIEDGSIDVNSTLVLFNCEDCVFTIESYCVKLYVQSCRNVTIHANTRIITSIIETFKCENLTLNINTDIGTLQADFVNGISVNVKEYSRFNMMVWAGCEDVALKFADSPQSLTTGYKDVLKQFPSISKERGQFKIHKVKGDLKQEKVIRLENGFTTTVREKEEFDKNQEAALQAMAKQMGITIKPKKGIKVKPNEPCPCGSGSKYKKCCFSVSGVYDLEVGSAAKSIEEAVAEKK
eukprot:m.305550 g.305550  ORF g.305550 m.305550 type:complete len:522 (-) comp20181_c2_seq6:133-1698(-)